MTRANDQLDTKEKRELYKAMRSAHDGICPCCGAHVIPADTAAYRCTSCSFYLSDLEVTVIKSWHEIFHHDLVVILARWRTL